MSLREPCEHGRWDEEHLMDEPDAEGYLLNCRGGRILTAAEALRALCENGDGTWSIKTIPTERGMAVADPATGQILEIGRAEALRLLLFDGCGTCAGTGWVKDDPECDDPDASLGGCPECWTGGVGGSGRRPKDGVVALEDNGGFPGWWFPTSMLEGDSE